MKLQNLVDILNRLVDEGFGDQPVVAYDGDINEMAEVSCVGHGGTDRVVELYTDDQD